MASRKKRSSKKKAASAPAPEAAPAPSEAVTAPAPEVSEPRAAAPALPPEMQPAVEPLGDGGEDGYIDIEITGEFGVKTSGRREARIPIAERVEVSGIFVGADEEKPRVTDVSLGGVFVETSRLLEVGDPVQLAFFDGSSKLRVSGRVRWVTPFGGLSDARAGMGVELVGVSDVERRRIYELLRGHRGRPSHAAGNRAV